MAKFLPLSQVNKKLDEMKQFGRQIRFQLLKIKNDGLLSYLEHLLFYVWLCNQQILFHTIYTINRLPTLLIYVLLFSISESVKIKIENIITFHTPL